MTRCLGAWFPIRKTSLRVSFLPVPTLNYLSSSTIPSSSLQSYSMAPDSRQSKRKASTTASSPNVKKSRKAAPTSNKAKTAMPTAVTIPSAASVKSSRAARKTAVDFLSDSEESDGGWDALKNGKSNKKGKSKSIKAAASKETNGASETTEEIIVPLKTETVPSGKRNVAADMVGSGDSDSEDEDQTTTLLQGFESSDDDSEDAHVVVGNEDILKNGVPNDAKVKKQLKELSGREKTTPGIIYLGRIPHGFYEHEMRSYFSQFGTVTRLRLSRNKKTGKSKHYAFIEFTDEDVAAIVAETMNNYLLFGHILKCKVVPRDNVEYVEKLMKGANKRFKPRPAAKLAKAELERKKPAENWEKAMETTNEKRKGLKKKWEARGIEYDFTPPVAKKARTESAVEETGLAAVGSHLKKVEGGGMEGESDKGIRKEAEKEEQPKAAPTNGKKKKAKKIKA